MIASAALFPLGEGASRGILFEVPTSAQERQPGWSYYRRRAWWRPAMGWRDEYFENVESDVPTTITTIAGGRSETMLSREGVLHSNRPERRHQRNAAPARGEWNTTVQTRQAEFGVFLKSNSIGSQHPAFRHARVKPELVALTWNPGEEALAWTPHGVSWPGVTRYSAMIDNQTAIAVSVIGWQYDVPVVVHVVDALAVGAVTPADLFDQRVSENIRILVYP